MISLHQSHVSERSELATNQIGLRKQYQSRHQWCEIELVEEKTEKMFYLTHMHAILYYNYFPTVA